MISLSYSAINAFLLPSKTTMRRIILFQDVNFRWKGKLGMHFFYNFQEWLKNFIIIFEKDFYEEGMIKTLCTSKHKYQYYCTHYYNACSHSNEPLFFFFFVSLFNLKQIKWAFISCIGWFNASSNVRLISHAFSTVPCLFCLSQILTKQVERGVLLIRAQFSYQNFFLY